jgi:mono/diheme cytochrome c family protein
MAERILLGLFHEATSTSDTIDQLHEAGIEDEKIVVMSSIPYSAEMLGRRYSYRRLGLIAFVGALSGLAAGLFLTVGTPLLYSIRVGGQPIIPIPPSIIILFEFTMLGTIVATFAGLIAETRFPEFGREIYDRRITEGHIGVMVRVQDELTDKSRQILESNGAHHMQSVEVVQPVHPRVWLRWAFIFVFLFIPTAIALLFVYSYLEIPLPDQMVDQISIAYVQGPRLAAPDRAVPIQGPVLIAGMPASSPKPATQESIQRGQDLYAIDCAMCHGADGKGDGPIASLLTPKPADLTSADVQSMSASEIFLVITQGKDVMPSIAESLPVEDRWDVINFVYSLK